MHCIEIVHFKCSPKLEPVRDDIMAMKDFEDRIVGISIEKKRIEGTLREKKPFSFSF